MSTEHNSQVTLADMRTGQTATVVAVLGGHGLVQRLDALGIKPGKKVTKLSSAPFRGPVILKANSTQVAVGFGMAKKIIVEIEKYLPPAS